VLSTGRTVPGRYFGYPAAAPLAAAAIGTPHNGRNTGPAPARILAGLMGAEGVGNSEKVE
jgi:hypothetical protein